MNYEAKKILFDLLRSAVCGNHIPESERALLSEDVLGEIFNISNKYDIAHLVSQGLYINGLITPENTADTECKCCQQFYKSQIISIYRYERIKHDYDKICETLEEEHIPFLPLKGAVIRDYYPEPWMRTSCDIDILVHKSDLKRVIDVFTEKHNYRFDHKLSHDVSMFSTSGLHIEFHYDLLEKGLINDSAEILSKVWDVSCVKNGYHCFYEMPDEMFYFYHIAHMAKHFENGGCGIRPFIDLWILDRIDTANPDKRNELLTSGKLLKFADTARRLSRVWFEGEKTDDLLLQMEDYILRGGLYGSNENRIIVQQQKKGGRLQYALSKIFIPYDMIKFYYPILQKHRWLTPIMEVRRWGKLIFCGHLKRTVKELNYNKNIDKTDADSTRKFLCDIGLMSQDK